MQAKAKNIFKTRKPDESFQVITFSILGSQGAGLGEFVHDIGQFNSISSSVSAELEKADFPVTA